eukprot:TRINITY_DN1806_c0_g2_i1.p1 TRINITY_DN1806_c0_g2~~TRINITY_DN1806_c0_g2_i1.p1  ORF type:complete len:102 (+),score=3.50 TRINITY_DN1806_c0_g2_i1:39-308(+)
MAGSHASALQKPRKSESLYGQFQLVFSPISHRNALWSAGNATRHINCSTKKKNRLCATTLRLLSVISFYCFCCYLQQSMPIDQQQNREN